MTKFQELLIAFGERLLAILDDGRQCNETGHDVVFPEKNNNEEPSRKSLVLSSLSSNTKSSLTNTSKSIQDTSKILGSSSSRSIGEMEVEDGWLAESGSAYCLRDANLESDTRAVLTHLNEKLGTRYRITGPGAKFIHARLADGFTVEECKRVVDNKILQWRGKADMAQYLRPETLFRPTKFEAYVNEATVAAPPTEEEKAAAYKEAYEKRMAEEKE
jgi:uncharacterized phage protein (TIGR02220 family)